MGVPSLIQIAQLAPRDGRDRFIPYYRCKLASTVEKFGGMRG